MNSESTDSKFYYINILKSLKNLELESNDSEEKKSCSKIAEHKQQFCADGSNLKYLINELEKGTVESAVWICELVAELAKDEQCRNHLLKAELFTSINKYLSEPGCTNSLRIQICRAIGNLCFENDDGRLMFLNTCGIDNLIDLLKNSGLIDFSQGDKQELVKLVVVSLGCLHNFANDNETIKQAVYQRNIMSILKSYIKNIKNDSGILMYFFSCIENLIESDEGKIQFVQEKIALDLYNQLDLQVLENLNFYVDDFFRILSCINEIDNSKELLCMTNFIETAIHFIENNTSDEDLLRIFGAYLTNLLTNNDNTDMIYKYKNNFILDKAIEWFEKFQSEQLYLASAIIIANYMQNDSKAMEVVGHSKQPHIKIINLLKVYSKFGNKATLQQINISHSLLSTLKNFCIAASSKEELLKHEVIEVVAEFLNYENLEVLWKALAIIRLLVKQCSEKNGLDLIFSDETLGKIEKIAHNPQEHPGVGGESSRLCCFLPIAAKSEKNLEQYSKFNFIDIICSQMLSNHSIMINEAILALNVLATIAYRACSVKLKNSCLNKNFLSLLENESLAMEIKINMFKLFKILFEKSDFFTESHLEQYLKIFNHLKETNQQNEIINAFLNQLINLLEKSI